MKKIFKTGSVVCMVALWTTAALADTCQSQYMKDPCSVDGYSMVEVEEFVPYGHNQMHILHHFNDTVATKKKARKTKKYRYIKKCRYIKVDS